MAHKLPAFQFYPGDWKKDPGVQSLTLEERGAWFEMLLLMHESEHRGKLLLNGKPYPLEFLATALHTTLFKIKQIVSKLLSVGVASREQNHEVIISRRMLRDEELRRTRAESGREGGKQKAINRLAKSTPSSSSSSSSSVSSSIPSKIVPTIPKELEGLELYRKDVKLIARWAELYPNWKSAYPQLDIMAEIRKAHAWELANSRKVNRPAFFVRWLNRAQDSLGRTPQFQRPAPIRVNQPSSKSACQNCNSTGFVTAKEKRVRGNGWPDDEIEVAAPCPKCRPSPAGSNS